MIQSRNQNLLTVCMWVTKVPVTTLSSFQTLSLAQEKLNVEEKEKKIELRLDCKSKINIFEPKICDELE